MQLNALIAAVLGLSFLAAGSPAVSQATDAGAIRLAQATEKADDDKGKSRRPERGDAKAKQEPKDAPKSAPKTTQDAAPKAPPSRETKQETKQEPKSDAAQRDRTGGADKAKQDAEKAARDAKSRSDDDAKSRMTRERAKEPETKQPTQDRATQPDTKQQTQDRATQPDTKQQTQERAKQPETKQQTEDRAKQPDTKQQTQDRARQPDTKQQTQDRRDDDRRDSSRERSKDDDRKDARDRGRDDDRKDARDRGRDDDRRDMSRGRDDDRRDRGADRERSREWSREREQRRTSREELSRTEIRGDRTITIDGGSRTIRRDGDRVVIRGYDFDRLRHGRDGRGDTRVERMPNGYTRTVVFYPDGTQIVTVTGTRGEIVQRFRRDRGGREVYFIREMRRPPVAQINLGPLRLTIPREQYIVDNRRASPQQIRAALMAPPVEAVERVYSLEEVRQFDRIRDKMRRIDIQTITFETDSAIVDPSQAQALEELANVILDLIERNPGEMFLIEGHTDLVGDEVYNLALSDRRAEAVAVALTDYFNVPPENLVTQGYGEQFPNIPTEIAERENRRVAVRRITPLVAEN
jgi:outer membrane protein OmpA-like peptidoglycan-associated protein